MPYSSLSDAVKGAQAGCFQASTTGETGHTASYYAPAPRRYQRLAKNPFEKESSLSFDISNQYIQASVDIEGTLQDARSARGVKLAEANFLRGVYVQKVLLHGGPWKLSLEVTGDEAESDIPAQTGLLDNLIPVSTGQEMDLICRRIAFAPQIEGLPGLPAIIMALVVQNQGQIPVAGRVILPDGFRNWITPGLALDISGQAGMAALEANPAGQDFSLTPGEEATWAYAFILAETDAEIRCTAQALRQKTALDWLNGTLAFHRQRLGELAISDTYYAEGLERMEELCRQSLLVLPDGANVGGTLGSNVNPGATEWWNTYVWMKDNFYAALPMAMFYPALCEQAILFYMRWGIPPQALGRGRERYPGADPLINSISNSLDSLVLASACYQMNANRAFFLAHPEFFDFARQALARLLKARQFAGIMLFPSMYVSDGDARGDFHTGSNLVAWYAFNGMARLCREVYQDEAQANEYLDIARQIRQDIERYCTGEGVLGKQYFEGAYMDGSFASCHDGEESDVALMPFYGFCEADAPALTRFSRLGLTPYNPLYLPGVDGIAWFDGGYSGSTFPGFTSGLAGAENEAELLVALERIRRLTDLDGSIWWWPHRLGVHHPEQVSRYPVKCCWAGSIYVLRFVHDILGIELDRPARKIGLRPFLPWDRFQWDAARIGSAVFDFHYQSTPGEVSASITNHNDETYEGTIHIMLPEGTLPEKFSISDEPFPADAVRFKARFGRAAYLVTRPILPGQQITLTIQFRRGEMQ